MKTNISFEIYNEKKHIYEKDVCWVKVDDIIHEIKMIRMETEDEDTRENLSDLQNELSQSDKNSEVRE